MYSQNFKVKFSISNYLTSIKVRLSKSVVKKVKDTVSSSCFLVPKNIREFSHDEVKFKWYLSIYPVLQKVLEGKFQPDEVNHTQENAKKK